MKKNRRIMKVPDSFYDTIKKISEKRNKRMIDTLDDSTRILQNADYLSDLLEGVHYAKKKRK